MVFTLTILLPELVGTKSKGLVPVMLELVVLAFEMVMSDGSSNHSAALTETPSVFRKSPEVSTKPPDSPA